VQAAKIRLRGGTRAETQGLGAVVVSWRRVTARGGSERYLHVDSVARCR
jgi:hypothetical protein